MGAGWVQDGEAERVGLLQTDPRHVKEGCRAVAESRQVHVELQTGASSMLVAAFGAGTLTS